jgi:hypothetical protein
MEMQPRLASTVAGLGEVAMVTGLGEAGLPVSEQVRVVGQSLQRDMYFYIFTKHIH